jgi:hypothetical protein
VSGDITKEIGRPIAIEVADIRSIVIAEASSSPATSCTNEVPVDKNTSAPDTQASSGLQQGYVIYAKYLGGENYKPTANNSSSHGKGLWQNCKATLVPVRHEFASRRAFGLA